MVCFLRKSKKVFPFEKVQEVVKKNLCRPARPALPLTELAFVPIDHVKESSERNVRAQGRQEVTTVNPCPLVSSAGMIRFLKFLGRKQRAFATT